MYKKVHLKYKLRDIVWYIRLGTAAAFDIEMCDLCVYVASRREYDVCACVNIFVTVNKPVHFNTLVIANFPTLLLLPNIDGV